MKGPAIQPERFTKSIGARLLAVNLLLWIGMASIVLIVFLSFGHVRRLVDNLLEDNLSQVLSNARIARTLSQVLGDTNLVVGTFYGRENYLESETIRLLTTVAEAERRAPNDEMRDSLRHISQGLAGLFERCREGNEGLMALETSDQVVMDDFDRLEKIISRELIDKTLAGETVSQLEQLAILVLGYRESALMIRSDILLLRPSNIGAQSGNGATKIIDLLKDLKLRLRALSAAPPEIADIGGSLGINLSIYIHRFNDYVQRTFRLRTGIEDFEAIRGEVLGRLAEIDAATAQAERTLRGEIDASVVRTKTAVTMLALVVLGGLAALTTLFLVTAIHRPVREVLRVVGAYRRGDLSARMNLKRGDEWALVESSLNTMAAELGALMRARDAAEKALRLSEEKYRGIFENAQEGIFRTTGEGRFESANPAMARMLGFDSPEALMSGVTSVAKDMHVDSQARKRLLAELDTRGQVADYQVKVRRRDGTIIIMSLTARLIRENGQVWLEGLAADVTERVRQEEELKAAKETAEKATQAKSIFLAKMSHELRTPLSGIIGLSELCIESASEGLGTYLRGIRQSAQDLLTLINDLLDFSKIEAGRFELEMMHFDLPATVEAAVSGLSYQARRKGLRLAASIAPGVPEQLIGDPYRLRRILVNLLGNAVKFTEQGSISLSVAPAGPDATGPRPPKPDEVVLAFTVADTGMGIPEDKQAAIFESFTQAEDGQDRKFGGTGLGLAICRELSELMGGRIWVVSRQGKGAAFTFTARFGLGKETAKDTKPSDEEAGPVLALSVLLAEDNPVNRLYATEILAHWGFTVQAVADGREVLHTLSAQPADVVLMDVEMPELDGIETTRRIRAGVEGIDPDTPIVALTAHVQPGDRERFLAEGMDSYATKPLVRTEVMHAIREALAARRELQAAQEDSARPPLLDDGEALARMTNDRELYAELLETYLEQLPRFLAELEHCLEPSRPCPHADPAMRLRGASNLVGAKALERAAATLAGLPPDERSKLTTMMTAMRAMALETGRTVERTLDALRERRAADN